MSVIKKRIFGYVSFKAQPDNAAEYINLLMDSDIAVYDLTCKDGEICGNISWYEKGRLKKFSERCGCPIKEETGHGLLYFLAAYRHRTGLYIGTLLAAALVFFASNTVLGIEVYGNGSISDQRVKDVLEEYGLSIGKFIPSVDIRQCERLALTSLDELKWIGIRNSGCIVKVEVSEITPLPQMERSNTPCNVVAARDAQIVDIRNVHTGMLVPMLYDGVRKGDILVSGTVKSSTGRDYYVRATGEIIGRYKESASFYQPLSDEVYEQGDSFVRESLYVFGLRIPLYLNRDIDSLYEYSESISYVNFIGLTLPIGTVRSEYRPYEIRQTAYTADEAAAILDEKAANYERNFFSGRELTVIDRKTLYTANDEGVSLKITYTIEGNIGETQDIMAKY